MMIFLFKIINLPYQYVSAYKKKTLGGKKILEVCAWLWFDLNPLNLI